MENVSYIIRRSTSIPGQFQQMTEHFSDWIDIPLLGTVCAGKPIDVFPYEDQIRVPSAVVKKESYALRVKGDSMIDDNIHDGDIIVVKSQTHADNGQSVIALINGQQTTLKKFYVEKNGIRLQPANSQMDPIYLHHDQVQILGIVQCVLRIPT